MDYWTGLAPELVWGLIPRALGLVYMVSFGSLIPQAELIAGSRGMIPIGRALDRVRRDFPGARRFWDSPTVLWWMRSDRALRLLPWLGVAAGACAVYGGTLGFAGLLVCWLLWLSLEPLGLIFPWDTLLLEAGFLALFFPHVQPLPDLHASALPLPTVAFMLRWLLLRLVFGFGKDKFIGARLVDSLYLRGFMVWQTLPSPIGWFVHHAPRWLQRCLLAFMFFAEIIAPILGLFSGPIRLFAWAVLVSLMFGIHVTGNWGHFQLAWVLLSLCLLDAHSSIFDVTRAPWSEHFFELPQFGVHVAMGAMFLLSLVYLPNNTWFTRSWVQWPPDMMGWAPRWQRVMNAVHRMLTPIRAIAPMRLVNGYGVFPPHSMPPLRFIPMFEGSNDGREWKPYDLKYMGCLPHSKPRFIAPMHPRFDMMAIYMCIQINSSSFFGSLLPYGNPYAAYARSNLLDLFAQKLLAGDPLYTALLQENPFPERPPKLIRFSAVAMTPTTPAELRATGNWWRTRKVVTLSPPRGLETWPERLQLPEPELFHPDFVAFKRRSQALQRVERAWRSGMALDRAVIEGSDLTAQDVTTFWDELLPILSVARGDWNQLHERAAVVQARFDVQALYRLERVLERFVWILRLRLEPHRLAAQAPYLPVMSNFRFHMVLHEMVLDGRAAYESYLAQPELAARRAQQTTAATELWVLTLMRYEPMMAHIAAFRLSEMGMQIHNKGMPGLFEYFEFLHGQVPPAEEFAIRAVLQGNGDHHVEGLYPAEA